jgi:hypothetical protein
MVLRLNESDGPKRKDKAVLLAIVLLTLIYVICVLILDADVIFPLG